MDNALRKYEQSGLALLLTDNEDQQYKRYCLYVAFRLVEMNEGRSLDHLRSLMTVNFKFTQNEAHTAFQALSAKKGFDACSVWTRGKENKQLIGVNRKRPAQFDAWISQVATNHTALENLFNEC